MITKIQNKPLYASLMAIVMASALALGGIGTAVGATNISVEEVNTNSEHNHFTVSNSTLTYSPCSSCINTSMAGMLSHSINNQSGGADEVELESDIPEFSIGESRSYDLNTFGLNIGDEITFKTTFYSPYSSYEYTYKVIQANNQSDNTDESTSAVAFTLKFKATGIQSTGFSDYKEAFAALND